MRRKTVLDYCFLHDHNLRIGEDLVVFSFHNMLTRDDIISLSAKTMITSNVIDCWSFLLNDMLVKAGKGLSSTRSFFCTSHSASLFKLIKAADDEKDLYRKEICNAWDTVIENNEGSLDIGADLTVDYLDNRVYDDFEDSIWVLATNSIVEIFGSFLVEKGFERGSEVCNFKFVNVAFGWKSKGSQNLDCGVFVMIHMMFYAGKLFKSELHDLLKRIIYRAEIAAILVLADINKIRKQLLDLVDDFTKTKAPLLPVLLKKRKLADLEAERAEADALEAVRVMAEEPDDGVGTPRSMKKSMPDTPMSDVMIRSGRGSRPNSDGLGCSIKRGQGDTNLVVVSKIMRANSRYTRAMPRKKKQVVDYCFLDDYNLANDELLFSTGNAILDRSDILSTKPENYTELRIIAAWSVVLNFMEVKEKEAPVMMFLGTQHMGIFEDMLEQGGDSDDA
ncbi:uncharacterized protein LOC141634468 [Silene latifolia]|uniref:uncharacterized protein LOC141634468 n=1 Tax=Silene latifolia TaxID=37657 RepID=UPI003D76E51A